VIRNKPVGVIGGGDSAMEEACFLARYASQVYIIHRFDYLEASKVMAKRARANPKIQVWPCCTM
jgi:thioredoxin reductase (NADPH)